jgi:hypothetical protein
MAVPKNMRPVLISLSIIDAVDMSSIPDSVNKREIRSLLLPQQAGTSSHSE